MFGTALTIYSKKQTMSSFYLPQEILYEIFLRLPPKSVGKFRCLSTLWNAQLSTPQFLTLHQSHKPYQQKLIIRSRSYNLYMIVPPTKNGDVWLPIPVLPGVTCFRPIGSSNGLVLLLVENRNFIIANPITRKQVLIPFPSSVSREDYVIAYGFGYDKLLGDYKVVALFRQYLSEGYTNVQVYCMKTRVWRTVVCPFGLAHRYIRRIMPLVNGALHWYASLVGSETCDRIVAFDLDMESFSEFPLPKDHFPRFSSDGLAVLGECLISIINFNDGSNGICMMNEYGNSDSWVRFYIPSNYNRSPIKPLCLVGDEKMLCTTGNTQCWAVCDLVDGCWSEFLSAGLNHVNFTDSVVIEESLVSPE